MQASCMQDKLLQLSAALHTWDRLYACMQTRGRAWLCTQSAGFMHAGHFARGEVQPCTHQVRLHACSAFHDYKCSSAHEVKICMCLPDAR
eukprot:354785-Pelagomonas_calceolata.AAC.3